MRLLPDGTIDSGFAVAVAGSALPTWVYAIVVQPNGKILIGGNFETINGEAHSEVARLNADGTLVAMPLRNSYCLSCNANL